jgi:cell wall-associated NlpC family hydrolase
MRVFPLAIRGLAVCVLLTVASAPLAQADNPSVGELQVRLVQSRMHLNDLLARSAAAAERLNGATFELAEAGAELKRQRAAVKRAEAQLADQADVVAALTVEQLQSSTGTARLNALFQSDGPQQLLERAGAYASTNEAMNARIDTLTARQVVRDAAARRADAAQEALRAAVRKRKAAAGGIDRAIAAAEAAVESTSRERDALLEQLASAQGVTVQAAERKQAEIDERIDQSGPSAPVDQEPVTEPTTDPEPSDPKPTQPTPKPTQPTPKPKPTPKPPSADPSPAQGSRVEKAIDYAMAQLGEPYKWGGAGPNSWDCSGLTMKAWGSAGVSLPHSASAQYSRTQKVSVGSIRRGDLVYWGKSPGSIHHVAMYLGGGKMIHAPRPGRNVEIVPITYWIKPSFASRPG